MEAQFQKGTVVLVTCYGGSVVKRRAIADAGRVIVVCNEAEYQRAESEGREADGIGFPKDAVRVYDGKDRETSY